MPTVRSDLRTDFEVHEEIPLALDTTLSCPVYNSAGDAQQATAGTFELLDRAGTVILSGNITTSPTVTATFAITAVALAAAGATYGYGRRVRWTLTIGGETFVATNMAGIVREASFLNVVDQDLLDLHGELLVLIQGTGRTDLSSWIVKAHTQAVRWMARQGNRAASVVDHTDEKELVVNWALELLFRDLSTGRAESHYADLAADYKTMREETQRRMVFAYDAGLDGEVDPEPRTGTGALFFSSHGLEGEYAHGGRYR